MNMYHFKIISNDSIDWNRIERCYDSTPYKSQRWAHFLDITQGVKPYVLEISQENLIIGYFYGQKIRRMGIPMIVSPFEGWTTSFQGISMINSISKNERIDIYRDLINYLFKNKQCVFFQASDWKTEIDDIRGKLQFETFNGYRLDLTQDFETVIYRNFKEKSAKYAIKKARKKGLIIKSTTDIESFSHNYYNQLIEVFGKQGLSPTYDISRIIKLCQSLIIGKDLLLFEAYLPNETTCIATGLFVKDKNLAIYYGAASYHEYQNLCPNELLMYEAIKVLSESGTLEMEFGGGRKYKEKYGPIPFEKPKIIAAKYSVLIWGKQISKSLFYKSRYVIAILKNLLKK